MRPSRVRVEDEHVVVVLVRPRAGVRHVRVSADVRAALGQAAKTTRGGRADRTHAPRQACASEQQDAVILVRNEGQSQLDQGKVW